MCSGSLRSDAGVKGHRGQTDALLGVIPVGVRSDTLGLGLYNDYIFGGLYTDLFAFL